MSSHQWVGRVPLQQLTPNNAMRKVSALSFQYGWKSIYSNSQPQRFHSLRARADGKDNYEMHNLPPRIQEWFDLKKSPIELSTRGAVEAREVLVSQREQLLDDITKQDPEFLEEVIREIRKDVLVGTMSEPVQHLCHTLMRWLRRQGIMAQIVEDVLLRLMEEEDARLDCHVNTVLFSIAIDAWAKQASSSPDAPQRAEALLQLMQDRYKLVPSRAKPRASHVSLVLVAWSNSTLPYAPQRAEQLLRWMEDESNNFPPDVRAYTSVIHGYARHGKPEHAERVLRLMEARLKTNPNGAVVPNVRTFTAVANAWGSANQGSRGAHMAEALRQRLEALYKEFPHEDLRPNMKLLTVLMQAWAKSDAPESGEKTQQLMKEILDLRESLTEEERKDPNNEISIIQYNRLMEAWSRSGRPKIADKILNELLHKISAGDKDAILPSVLSWTTVALGWARQGNVKQTENVLKRMHESYCEGISPIKSNVVMYNALLIAWRRSKDPSAANKAQRLLDWMTEQADNGREELRPNDVSYEIVLSAWKDSQQTEKSGKMALQLLSRLENYLETSGKSSDVAALSYETALATVAKGGKKNTHLEVLKLLHHMEEVHKKGLFGPILTNHSYHIAITACAWSPTRDGEELAEDILRRMEDSSDPGFRPKRRSYEATCAAWARSFKFVSATRAYAILKRLEERAKEPNSFHEPSDGIYNYVLAACMASRDPESANIAREVLTAMVEKRSSGDEMIYPRPGKLKLLFGDAFDRRDSMSAAPVVDLIMSLEDPCHDQPVDKTFLFSCYLYGLTVYGWSADDNAAVEAERLWEQMVASNYVDPNLDCLNSLLFAYSNFLDVELPDESVPVKAEELLRTIEREYAKGIINWRPDTTSYDCVVELLAKSKLKGAPDKAFQLLERMDAMHKKHDSDSVKPTGNTYSMVLLACALTPAGDKETKLHNFNIAVRAFNHLRDSEYCEPNRNLYNRLLMCAIYLAPDHKTRVKMTKHIFMLCCRTGHVDRRIFKHYWNVAPKREREQLLGRDDDDVKFSDLPPEYSVNTRTESSSNVYQPCAEQVDAT